MPAHRSCSGTPRILPVGPHRRIDIERVNGVGAVERTEPDCVVHATSFHFVVHARCATRDPKLFIVLREECVKDVATVAVEIAPFGRRSADTEINVGRAEDRTHRRQMQRIANRGEEADRNAAMRSHQALAGFPERGDSTLEVSPIHQSSQSITSAPMLAA